MCPPVTKSSSPEDKIALFRSLFRGRDDVYPRRFESRNTGKSGYTSSLARVERFAIRGRSAYSSISGSESAANGRSKTRR